MRQAHRMALRADHAGDLKAAVHRSAIVGAEGPVEGPGMRGQRWLALGLRRGGGRRLWRLLLLLLLCRGGKRDECGTQERERKPAHHGFSIGRAAPASRPPPFGVTAAAMLVGSG